MEIFKNQTSGLYWIELGGVLFNNCSVDADCPGRAKCAVNASWAQYDQMCFCDFLIALQGADCNELSATTWFFYIGNIIATIISCVWLAVSIFDLIRMIRWRRFHRDALSTSLIFVLLGLFFTALQCGASTRFVIQIHPPDESGSKLDRSAVTPISLAFAYLFSTLGLLNVSVVWIEVAENADKMRKSGSNNVSRYKKALALYYIFFFGIIAVTLAVDQQLIAAAFAVPGAIFVIITYVVGAYKMNKMLGNYITSSTQVDGMATVTSSKDAVRKVRESLQRIQKAALGVSFFTFMFVVWMGLWVLQGGFANQPGKNFNVICVTLPWVAVASGNATVAWYLHGAIQKKGRAMASADKNAGAIVAIERTRTDMPSHQKENLTLAMNTATGFGVTKEPTSQDNSSSMNSPRMERPGSETITTPDNPS